MADNKKGRFDHFAESVSLFVSRPPFFIACLALVGVWLVEGAARIVAGGWHNFLDDKYQLQINTTTTIITFLMVAVLQNSQQRFENTMNGKFNAVADGLADLMEYVANSDVGSDRCQHLLNDVAALRDAVGLEHRQSV